MDLAMDNTPKRSPQRWQSKRHIERGTSGRNLLQPEHVSAQARIKNSLRGTVLSVIKTKEEDKPDDPETYFFKCAGKLNVNLEVADMARIRFSTDQYYRDYEELKTLGEGCIGLVKSIRRISDDAKFAVKQVTTDDEEIVRNMINEFRNLATLSHPNIIKMYELYVDFNDGFQKQSKVLVVMELVEGSEMFQHIQELGNYTEDTTKELFKQLLEGITYLHSHGICHRDLKPNNLLCDGLILKIADFNVSKFSESYKGFKDITEVDQIEMWTFTGTVAFSAPEIFVGAGYNEKVDLWSAGCILYTMLSGDMPFAQEYLNDLIDTICSGIYSFPQQKWNIISAEAKDLIEKLLALDPEHRPSAHQALKHKWFEDKAKTIASIKRSDLALNMRHLSRKHERKNRKHYTNCLLFGARHLIGKTKSEEHFHFDPLLKQHHHNTFIKSAGLLKDDPYSEVESDHVHFDETVFCSPTSIGYFEPKHGKSHFAQFQTSPDRLEDFVNEDEK